MSQITIVELNRVEGFTGKIKVTGTSDEVEARMHINKWCEENNSVCKELLLDANGDFIADTCSDDYD